MCCGGTKKGKRKKCPYLAVLILSSLSVFASILAIVFAAGIEIALDGPVPTTRWYDGSRMLFFENVLAIIVFIVCITIVALDIQNLYIGSAVMACMPIILVLSLGASICFLHFPGAREMSPYVTQYYKDNSKEPPAMKFLQAKTAELIPGGYSGLSCCGGADFLDYANFTKKGFDGRLFTAPDSCCSKNKRKHGCGTALDFVAHMNLLKIMKRLIKISELGPEYTKEIERLIDNKAFSEEKVSRLLETYGFNEDEIEEVIQEYVVLIRDYDKIVVGILGCGMLLDEIYKINSSDKLPPQVEKLRLVKPLFKLFIALIAFKLIIVFTTVGLYSFYYINLISSPHPVSPE